MQPIVYERKLGKEFLFMSYKACKPSEIFRLMQERGGKIDGVVVIDGDDQALGYYSLEFEKDSIDGTVRVYRNGVYKQTIKVKDITHSLYVPDENE